MFLCNINKLYNNNKKIIKYINQRRKSIRSTKRKDFDYIKKYLL